MEILLPVAALASLYFINKKDKEQEAFSLPNTDIPDANYSTAEDQTVLDKTSKIFTQNKTNINRVYTDKYFTKSAADSDDGAKYVSLDGKSVGSDYFQHKNMAPFFGSKIRTHHTHDHVNESILDSYSGAGSQTIDKKEIAPLFAPSNNTQWAHGMPNNNDFVQSRITPSLRQNGVKPFEEIRVGPGIGLGYTSEGSGGFNSGLQSRDLYTELTVDQLRTTNKPKASGLGLLGHEGPASHFVQVRAEQGIQEKHGPPTAFENNPDRYMKTTGVNKESGLIPVHVIRDVARPETSVSYVGGAGYYNDGDYIPGQYRPSHGTETGQGQFNPASAVGRGAPTEEDYARKSATKHTNNRMVNADRTGDYFGSVRGYVNEAIAPLLDVVRPSRKENTMSNTRTYQNPRTAVAQSYMINSTKAKPTIRQTTDASQWKTIAAPAVGRAYGENRHEASDNARQETGDFYYAGGSHSNAKHLRNYDAEYAIRNDGSKEKTVDIAYTPSGNTKLFNGTIHMPTTDNKESLYRNSRDSVPSYPQVLSHRENMGVSTIGDDSLIQNQQMNRIRDMNVQEQLKNNPFYNKSLSGGL